MTKAQYKANQSALRKLRAMGRDSVWYDGIDVRLNDAALAARMTRTELRDKLTALHSVLANRAAGRPDNYDATLAMLGREY